MVLALAVLLQIPYRVAALRTPTGLPLGTSFPKLFGTAGANGYKADPPAFRLYVADEAARTAVRQPTAPSHTCTPCGQSGQSQRKPSTG